MKKAFLITTIIFFFSVAVNALVFWLVPKYFLSEKSPPLLSGAEIDFDKDNEELNSIGKLKDLLPYSAQDFSLNYILREDKFTVSLKKPYDQSLKEFESFLSTNNLTAIPREKFTFQNE